VIAMDKIQSREIGSEIESVTVFADRAMVTRKAKISLAAGDHRLIFPDLPERVEENSVQVNGSGGGVLKDIRCKLVYFTDTPTTDKKQLIDEKTDIEDKLRKINDTIARAKQEKQFVEKIIDRVTGFTEESSSGELNPENWMKMISFYHNQLESMDIEIQNQGIKKRDTEEHLHIVDNQLAQAGEVREWVKRQVEVLIGIDSESEIELSLVYIVKGPSWHPVYNLRADSDEMNMFIEYNAVVKQNTHEDWNRVDLKLSTAKPQISGTVPQLSSWFLEIIRPVPIPAAPMEMASAPGIGRKKYASGGGDYEEALAAEAEPDFEVPTADVEEGTASVVFSIPGKTDVASDNNDYQVSVRRDEFKVEFIYETVPKLSPYAYLRAKVTNTSAYPLLPGETYIFLDGTYVANSSVRFIAPEEEFRTSLGVDESMKVEHTLLKRYIKKEGLLGKRETVIYEYRIDITNNKKADQKITVKDRIPVSNNQDIVVKLLKPEFKQNTDELSKNEENLLTWKITVKTKECVSIPFSFSVEYPIGERIRGL